MKTQKNDSQNKSPFWKPSKSRDSIQGKFVMFRETLFNKGKKDERKGVNLVLSSCQIGLSWALADYFAPIYSKIKIGDTIKVVFKGKVKTGNKRTVKKFDVYLNGKQLAPGISLKAATPASPKALKSFFANPS